MSARDEWLARQMLPPRRGVSIRDVLARAGWMPTAGGTGAYIALRARIPSVTRQEIDRAAFQTFEILDLPGPRTSFLVPREDAGLALAAGRRTFQERTKKLDLKPKEIESLGERILKTIGAGVRSVEQLRRELPSKLIRDLGPEGVRAALPNTLGVALRHLQAHGALLRVTNVFRAWPEEVPIREPEDIDRELAERFVQWSSPTNATELAAWAGIGKTAAKSVLSGAPPPRAAPAKGTFLLPFRDNYFPLHRPLSAYVDDPAGIKLLDHTNKPAPLEKLDSLHHNAIVVDGRLAGIWEYDRKQERIRTRMFGRHGSLDAATEMQKFVREQLGDHRFYAVDHAAGRDFRLQFVVQINK